MPPGPDARVKITEAYAKLVARDAYFWAWPLVNIFNRRQAFKDVTENVMAGPVPTAPLNRVAMLTDYITPEQRIVACPNQDVVYGAGSLALDITPVVIQVPNFGDRFWVYQVVDLRTDGVVQLGKMSRTPRRFMGSRLVTGTSVGGSSVFLFRRCTSDSCRMTRPTNSGSKACGPA